MVLSGKRYDLHETRYKVLFTELYIFIVHRNTKNVCLTFFIVML